MLELPKTIRVSHAVARPFILILFDEQDWQGGVFKFMKNDHFKKKFISFGLFLKFLDELMSIYVKIA